MLARGGPGSGGVRGEERRNRAVRRVSGHCERGRWLLQPVRVDRGLCYLVFSLLVCTGCILLFPVEQRQKKILHSVTALR